MPAEFHAQELDPNLVRLVPIEGNITALNHFFQSLRDLELRRRFEPVRVLWIGDSHTAIDRASGLLRSNLQERFGDAGRGMLAPGKPWEYFYPRRISPSQSDDWTTTSSFSKGAEGPFGFSGFRTTSASSKSTMSAKASGWQFEKLAVETVVGPGRGRFRVIVDGQEIAVCPTSSETIGVRFVELTVPEPATTLTVKPVGDGPVEILSWTLEKTGPGVVLDSHGIVGATVDLLSKWDQSILQEEIRYRDPALILLVFGTNEGFEDRLSMDRYRTRFAGYLKLLRTLAPEASILVVGPPDGNRISSRCLHPRDAKGRRLPKKSPADFDCAPLSDDERARYKELFPRQGEPVTCRWHVPPNLGTVRTIQREETQRAGLAFWDWSQLMGGDCGMHRWYLADPSLAQSDHVHLTRQGYLATGQRLYEALIAEYDRFVTEK